MFFFVIINIIVLINFILKYSNSYASGKKPWKNGEDGYEPQSYSDSKLEVVGFQTADFVSVVKKIMK